MPSRHGMNKRRDWNRVKEVYRPSARTIGSQISFSLRALNLLLEVKIRIRGTIEHAIGGKCWQWRDKIDECGIDRNNVRVWFRPFVVRFRYLMEKMKSFTDGAGVGHREAIIEFLLWWVFFGEVPELLGGRAFIAPVPSLLKESPLERKRPPFVFEICKDRFRTRNPLVRHILALRSNIVMKCCTASRILSIGTFWLGTPDYDLNVSRI